VERLKDRLGAFVGAKQNVNGAQGARRNRWRGRPLCRENITSYQGRAVTTVLPPLFLRPLSRLHAHDSRCLPSAAGRFRPNDW
jgi:hypothetical protein